MDADPSLQAAQKTVTVKILSEVQPQATERLAYSISARVMRAPRSAAGKTNTSAKDAA